MEICRTLHFCVKYSDSKTLFCTEKFLLEHKVSQVVALVLSYLCYCYQRELCVSENDRSSELMVQL